MFEFEFVIVVAVIMLVAILCFHHHQMKNKLELATHQDLSLIREAAEASMLASTTISPGIALQKITTGVSIINSLHKRYGIKLASELTSINTSKMLSALQSQESRVIQDIRNKHTGVFPVHPFSEAAGIAKSQ